jgi:hypothetical protein
MSSPTISHIRQRKDSKIAKDMGKKLLNKSASTPSLTPSPPGANKVITPIVVETEKEPARIGILDTVIKVVELIRK